MFKKGAGDKQHIKSGCCLSESEVDVWRRHSSSRGSSMGLMRCSWPVSLGCLAAKGEVGGWLRQTRSDLTCALPGRAAFITALSPQVLHRI
jgi:hypothetical protein